VLIAVDESSQQLCGAALSAVFAKMAVAQQQTQDMSGKQHSMPEKPAEIAMLIYPGMTALDLIGPQQVFDYLPASRWSLSPRRRTW